MSGDVEKWGEEGARALFKSVHGRDGYHDALPATQTNLKLKASASISAFLAAAEADGVVLVRVPDAMDWRHAEGAAQGFKVKGWNDALAAVLASKVTL